MTARIQRKLPASVEQDIERLCGLVAHRPKEIRTAGREQIAAWLYQWWYCTSRLPVAEAGEGAHALRGRTDLSPALRVALASASSWQKDWIAMHVSPDGRCILGRGNDRRELQPGEYANIARPGCPLAPGDLVAIRAKLDWTDQPTGFWYAQSAAGVPDEPRMRVYFSVHAQHVGIVLHAITATLDEIGVRYLLKCPFRPAEFTRVDSLIVYLRRDDWERAGEPLAASARNVSQHLRPESPPLTCIAAPGMSYAQDPGNKQSFGESRCHALAAGVMHLMAVGYRSYTHARGVLVEALCAAGIDPLCPWNVLTCPKEPECPHGTSSASETSRPRWSATLS